MDVICKNCGTMNDYRTEKKANNLLAYCLSCGAYIKNIPYTEPAIHFGKYKGKFIKDYHTRDEVRYLQWAYQNIKLNESVRRAIELHLNIRTNG